MTWQVALQLRSDFATPSEALACVIKMTEEHAELIREIKITALDDYDDFIDEWDPDDLDDLYAVIAPSIPAEDVADFLVTPEVGVPGSLANSSE